MQIWTLIALCSFFLFGAGCGKQESTAPPESSSETQIQEIDEPGIPPHFDGPELLRSQPSGAVNEHVNDPATGESQ